MIRHRTAAIAATTITALAIIGGVGIAYAASSVNVPTNGGQLVGPVDICVNTANEGQQYVELQHPAPGNCAGGYLQYTANQPASSSTPPPVVNTNSEDFTAKVASAGGTDTFTVSLPVGSHLAGVVSAVDETAPTLGVADAVTVKSSDSVTGAVTVAYSEADPATHTIQITYDYSR